MIFLHSYCFVNSVISNVKLLCDRLTETYACIIILYSVNLLLLYARHAAPI